MRTVSLRKKMVGVGLVLLLGIPFVTSAYYATDGPVEWFDVEPGSYDRFDSMTERDFSLGYEVDTTRRSYPAFAEEVLRLVNEERKKVGVPPLVLADDLMDAATMRAPELIRKFSHTRPDGTRSVDMIWKHHVVGENIAAGSATPAAVVNQWMHSPGHRANILYPDYRELGVGYYQNDSTRYQYYWVQIFRG